MIYTLTLLTLTQGAGNMATTTLSWVNIPNGILADVYSGQALSGWSAKVQKSAGLVSGMSIKLAFEF